MLNTPQIFFKVQRNLISRPQKVISKHQFELLNYCMRVNERAIECGFPCAFPRDKKQSGLQVFLHANSDLKTVKNVFFHSERSSFEKKMFQTRKNFFSSP
ncbi:MAG: hypothetical protein C0507_13585 [Cyanobacteria bacterium PR.3.49]|nr:hypothetical protein [Cyanobacteria bacterium PR.3.49]